jgi:peptide/nickel transport system substrate-binding protein
MKRKVIALLCITAMVIGLFTGCGGGKTEEVDNQPSPTTSVDNSNATADEPTVAPDSTTGTEEEFSEAPQLTTLVQSGAIPEVTDRLPIADDVMVEAMESIGTYGEAFNFTHNGKGSQWWYGKVTEEGLFRFKADGTIEPNVAKSFDVNENATEFTIYLREGMKWSDGVDFTAEDVIFFYEHMAKAESFGKSLWDCFKINDPDGNETIAEFVKLDDYSVKVTFQYPKPSFLQEVAINAKWLFAPAHWYKEVLPEFIGEEAADAKAKEMGYSDVAAMGKETGYYYWNVPGRPTLRPWVVTADGRNNDPDGEYFVMERNPYYWKVDAEGKQLPYIDQLRFTRISDPQQGLLKVLDGSVDFSGVGYADYDVLVENQESAGYELLEWSTTAWADLASQLQLNQTVKDENKRTLFQNADFRQALSIAVDRDEYSAILTDSFANGKQASPNEGAFGYSEEWENKWTEYNPEKAKELLDAAGLVIGSDGYFDFANGTDFVLNIQTFTDAADMGADKSAELLMMYFDKVGIKTTYKPVDRSVLDNMTISNDHEAIIYPVAPAMTFNLALRPDTLVPVRNYAPWYGAIGDWFASDGEEGVAPTGDLLKLTELYEQMRSALTMEEKEEIALEMMQLHEDNVWVIGYTEALPFLIAKKTNIMNFPKVSVFADEFRDLGIAHLAQLYFAE